MIEIFKKAVNTIKNRKIKIIGLGGIGNPVSIYLAKFFFALKTNNTIYLIDGDKFESKNVERVAFSETENKAKVTMNNLKSIYGNRVNFRSIPVYISSVNISQMISENDIIFLCVDNHACRKLVSNHCERLNDFVLFSGGNDGIENGMSGTFGNVQIFEKKRGHKKTNSITQFHPEISQPQDINPGEQKEQSCTELVSSVPQLAITNLAVASSILNAFTAWSGDTLRCEEIYIDVLKQKMTSVKRKVINDDAH